MNWVTIITLILQIVPKILDAVLYAEKLFKETKQGVIKKSYVMRIVEDAIDSGELVHPIISAYRQPFLEAVSQFVDAIVSMMNATGVFSKKISVDITPKEDNRNA